MLPLRRLLNQSVHAAWRWAQTAGDIAPGTKPAEEFGTFGRGSWIGHGAIVLPGTTIGRNVVVAAGSVVRGTIEDHAIVAGVPARLIRRLEPGVGWTRENGDDLRAIAAVV